MSSTFDIMRWNNLKDEYRAIAKAEHITAEWQKREAEAKALKAIADALKEHGDPEQYETCRAAIATLFEDAMEGPDINSDAVEAES